jgi:enterochelin esterase family protein
MKQLGDVDLYYLTLSLPPDARIDYKFYVDGLWMLDPLNDRTVKGGFGPNSAFAMPAYEEPREIEYVDSIPHGEVESHTFESGIMGNSRTVQVYLPPGYDPDGSYHTVYAQDGGEYITLGSMVEVLDYLIWKDRVPPVVAVFIDPVDRNYEYFLNADYERAVVEEIVPFIRSRYGVSREPGRNAVMGASLGGAVSMMIALNNPDVFGKCGSQSGALEIDEGRLLRLVEQSPVKEVDFYLDTGIFGDLTLENRTMREILMDKGYNFRYAEFHEGHSWGNWRAHIDDMLEFFWGKESGK